MRHPSVSAVPSNNVQQVREEKEKVMRKSFTAAVALVAVIAATTPAAAAAPSGKNTPRQETSVRERDKSPVLKAISRFLKKFGISTHALPIGPWPNQDNNEGDN